MKWKYRTGSNHRKESRSTFTKSAFDQECKKGKNVPCFDEQGNWIKQLSERKNDRSLWKNHIEYTRRWPGSYTVYIEKNPTAYGRNKIVINTTE